MALAMSPARAASAASGLTRLCWAPAVAGSASSAIVNPRAVREMSMGGLCGRGLGGDALAAAGADAHDAAGGGEQDDAGEGDLRPGRHVVVVVRRGLGRHGGRRDAPVDAVVAVVRLRDEVGLRLAPVDAEVA